MNRSDFLGAFPGKAAASFTGATRPVITTLGCQMKIDQKVKLVSFNGSKAPDSDCDPSENYWQLIGCTGSIVDDQKQKTISSKRLKGNRVLVQFDCSVNDLGLHCHNSVPNSLWIMVDDLKIIQQ